MSEQIKNKAVTREILTQVYFILSTYNPRTQDLKSLTVERVERDDLNTICEIFINEMAAKERGLTSFKAKQIKCLREFLETAHARRALKKREKILAEKSSSKP